MFRYELFSVPACFVFLMVNMLTPLYCSAQGDVGRQVDTAEQLVDALNDAEISNIFISPGIYELIPPAGTDSVAVIERSLTVTGSGEDTRLLGGGDGSNFRLAIVPGGPGVTDVVFSNVVAQGFSIIGDGGVFLVGNGANEVRFEFSDSTLSENSATGNGGGIATREQSIATIKRVGMALHTANEGGAMHFLGRAKISESQLTSNIATGDRGSAIFSGGPQLVVLDTLIEGNQVSGSGDAGAIAIDGETRVLIRRNVFNDNRDSSNSANNISFVGLAFDVCLTYKSLGCITALVDGNTFIHHPGNIRDVSVRQREGTMVLRNNTFKSIPDNGSALIYSSGRLVDGGVLMQGNLTDIDGFSPGSGKALCRDFAGVGLIQSDGYNISEDDTCMLDGPGDQPSTDPMLDAETSDGVVALKPGSPAIDGALAAVVNGDSDCSYRDVRGLGRPQDGNGDGVFECDAGAWEMQGGPDIGAAQSAAYFDAGRNGEGVFVEMLGNGLAFVAMFTYASDGQGLVWFVGLGNVVGNSVVIDEVLQTSGGFFGPGFDPELIVRTDVGGMALVFPTCQATDNPGLLNFEPGTDSPFGGIVSAAGRLTTILDCGATAGASAGRSGSFFDPARDGEGIFVQWLSNGQVVVIWYTYSPDGQQFWTISANAQVSANTVTANMVYPAAGTAFGSEFDASEIALESWGTVTLTYSDCDNLALAWDSVLPGFGQGSYNYVRLTTLDGTTCDL